MPVTKFRCAAYSRHLRERIGDRSDDDLGLPDYPVDRDADRIFRLRRRRRRGTHCDARSSIANNLDSLTSGRAAPRYSMISLFSRLPDRAVLDLDHLADSGLRNGKSLIVNCDDERVGYCKC